MVRSLEAHTQHNKQLFSATVLNVVHKALTLTARFGLSFCLSFTFTVSLFHLIAVFVSHSFGSYTLLHSL